jgi:hypothetical protein
LTFFLSTFSPLSRISRMRARSRALGKAISNCRGRRRRIACVVLWCFGMVIGMVISKWVMGCCGYGRSPFKRNGFGVGMW